jgi:predicted phosphate transport protein (TIGR00153 family)
MKNSFFSKFTPKESKFFPLLKELAEVANEAALQLIGCVESNNQAGSQAIFQSIRNLEHTGDNIILKIYDHLNTTFITPFDREDINNLSNGLDDIVDLIYGCAKRIAFYKPRYLPDQAIVLANVVKQSTEHILEAVDELDVLKKNPVIIKKRCEDLHNLESQADEIFQNFTIELFEKEKDAIEIIKLKEILNVLESITDQTDHVGKIIKTIIVKYA